MLALEPAQYHAVVTDPPYELGFMGRAWDASGVAYDGRTWRAVMHVARPGAHLLAFGGSRTWHRMVCAIEDAEWEIRDCVMWVYGSGFPKGLDVGKAIDDELGAEREVVDIKKRSSGMGGLLHRDQIGSAGYHYKQEWGTSQPVTEAAQYWDGWNTVLKPAVEPIVLARRGVPDTVAKCVLENGTGAVNVGACKVGGNGKRVLKHVMGKQSSSSGIYKFNQPGNESMGREFVKETLDGRYPSNFICDGSDEVIHLLPEGAARFFYSAKASSDDRPHGRDATIHPTVKPLDLMRYLVKLVCAPGGWVLDPFTGSGSTGCAAIFEGMRFVGVEQSQEYADVAVGRLKLALESKPQADTPDAWSGVPRRSGSAPLDTTSLWDD